MFLLQASSEQGPLLILQLVLRIIGVIVCSKKAKELNRSEGGWGFFGFMMPIVAMIWVYCMKPKMKWDEQSQSER